MYHLMEYKIFVKILPLLCDIGKSHGITKLCHVIILNSESNYKPI